MDQENTPVIDTLKKAGLTTSQAKGYLALIEYGAMSPTEIAKKTGENRTNGYMIAEKLEKLGLIEKTDAKKATYTALHPSKVEMLAEKHRRTVERNEQLVKKSMPQLINHFNEYQKTPGVQVHYGREGTEAIYQKILKTKETMFFVRSQEDRRQNKEALFEFIDKRIQSGIPAESISSSEFAHHSRKENDKMLLKRTLLPKGDYTSPVEIDIFGDNVAFIDYDNDSMSTLIESENIADAMRQFFQVAQKYVELQTDQEKLYDQVEQNNLK